LGVGEGRGYPQLHSSTISMSRDTVDSKHSLCLIISIM
jgi:hypothetical protein